MDNIRFDPISYPMTILLFIVIGLIIFILIIEPRFTKRKLRNKNEHGSSKFADIKEIRKNFDKEELKTLENVGFPVWYDKDTNNQFKSVYFDTKSPHYLLVGSTGSGKSVTVSIPMAIHFATAKEKHSIVFTDPKGELFKTTGKVFEENGYDIVTVDFRNPQKSTKINIMQPVIDEWKEHCFFDKLMMFFLSHFIKVNRITLDKIVSNNQKYIEQIKGKYLLEDYILNIIKSNHEEIQINIKNKKFYETDIFQNYTKEKIESILKSKNNVDILDYIKAVQNKSAKHQAETNRLVISLANLIFTERASKDPFWINAAKQLFVGIVGIFLEDYKGGFIDENKINISSVKKFQNSSLIKENQVFLQKNLNLRSYGSLSKDYLTSILSSAENTYKSITAIFAEKMSIFDDLNVENITSISEFSFTSLGKKPTALYLIVPDEDRTYFQLITIILGMLIKDLTKFANLSENNGVLPIRVEWLLDEFANCPPLDSIETVVSVARSRGMRFYFFIQSFAQLDQLYGKEIASIIQDNAALCYLKTNSVECAEIIAKKLGRATVETQSISMSTDVFKVGANQTNSLMGKELLTANEIISLKYKTIIFPTFGNPIFRDTYMYSDIYPQYVDYPVCERKNNILKRLTENYYTVEKMKEFYDNKKSSSTDIMTRKIVSSFQKETNKKIRQIKENVKENHELDQLFLFIQEIKNMLKEKIISETKNNDVYVLEISSLFNKFEISKIMRMQKAEFSLSLAENKKMKRTILSIWDNKLEMRL